MCQVNAESGMPDAENAHGLLHTVPQLLENHNVARLVQCDRVAVGVKGGTHASLDEADCCGDAVLIRSV